MIQLILGVALLTSAFVVRRRSHGSAFLPGALVAGGVGTLLLGAPEIGRVLGFGAEFDLSPSELEELAPFGGAALIIAAILGVLWLASLGFAKRQRRQLVSMDGTEIASLTIPRRDDNSIARANQIRDGIREHVRAAAAETGVEITDWVSPPLSDQVWYRADFSFAAGTEYVTRRASLRIRIERFDFHRFEHVFEVDLRRGRNGRAQSSVIRFDAEDAHRAVEFVAAKRRGRAPKFRTLRLAPLQLWKPRNRLVDVAPDWAAIILSTTLVAAGLAAVFLPVLWILAAANAAFLFRYLYIREIHVLTTGKPMHDPFQLRLLDSWQTVLKGLGHRAAEVRAALEQQIANAADAGVEASQESFAYPGVDGKVERRHTVLRFRRAVAFVDVEEYGPDLYVGWNSHVNLGTWTEQTIARGVHKETEKPVVANRVVAGRHQANEYDLVDASMLAEWTHAATKQVVRAELAQREIDLDIDFTIQREARNDVLNAKDSSGGSGGAIQRIL